MRFLGVELAGNVPEARTVWAFRESLKEHKLAEVLFKCLNRALADMGIELKNGQIIDALYLCRSSAMAGTTMLSSRLGRWRQDTEQPNKLAHKDTDARWTKKGGQNRYGYKNPINIDKNTKPIASQASTDASVHDC